MSRFRLAVFLGGLVSGFSGFAFSAAAGAILLHFLQPIQAIPLMMICSIATQATSMVMVRNPRLGRPACHC